MKTFFISTLGCKVNQYESQQIYQLLESLGLRCIVRTSQKVDIALINTCCVTHIASAKSRQTVRKIRRQNPNAQIVVTGCLPAGQPDELRNLKDDYLTFCQKEQLADYLKKLTRGCNVLPDCSAAKSPAISKPQNRPKIKPKNNLSLPRAADEHCLNDVNLNLPTLKDYKQQTRAFLKVQDGCDGNCSYCIIPRIRTNVCSKDVKTAINEAKKLVNAGHGEVVLTGIFLGAYGRDTVRRKNWVKNGEEKLAELVDGIAQVKGLKRLRLSSLEPADVTEKLLDVMSSHENIVPHLHLPMQSGSQKILKRMCRQYTLEEFLQVVDMARDRLDRPAITTDVIVGFPGETEDDFEQTMKVSEETGFAKIHVFSFSPRAGTAAAKMQGQLPHEVINERSRRLRGLDAASQRKFRRGFRGEKVGIIVETEAPKGGRCERYFMVKIEDLEGAGKAEVGQMVSGILLK